MKHYADLVTGEGEALWFNTFGDLADAKVFRHSAMAEALTANVEVAEYAGGGLRVKGKAGLRTTYAVTFHRLQHAERLWLRAHIGVVMVIRDHTGRRAVGTWASAQLDDLPSPVWVTKDPQWWSNASLTFLATHVGPLGPVDSLAGL